MKESTQEIPPHFKRYIELVSPGVLIHSLEDTLHIMQTFLHSWDEDMARYRYAPNKWTAGEVIMHVIDTERIMAYRALRFARNDQTELPGFNENTYGQAYTSNLRTVSILQQEFSNLRKSTIDLFSSFSAEELDRSGIASGTRLSVRIIGEIIVGHQLHHKNILEERYFPNLV